MASVGRLIKKVNDTGEEVKRLVEGLMRRGMRERAIAVQSAMLELVALCEASVKEAFGADDGVRIGQSHADARSDAERSMMADETLTGTFAEANKRNERPLVRAFERMAL